MSWLQAMTVLACGGWMGVSSALILVNKHCMSDDGFAFPMALSGLGMAFSGVASAACCKARSRPHKEEVKIIRKQITRFFAPVLCFCITARKLASHRHCLCSELHGKFHGWLLTAIYQCTVSMQSPHRVHVHDQLWGFCKIS